MFRIISDIGADIPAELKSSMTIVNQDVNIDGENVIIDSDERSIVEFYKRIDVARTYATRALRLDEIVVVLEREQGKGDILCFSFSQRLSATGAQMEKACNMIDGKPNRIVYYDTRTATIGQGLMIYLAQRCNEQGLSIDQTVAYLKKVEEKLSFYVILDKSSHFFSGGRAANLNNESLYYPVLKLPLGELYQCIGYTLSKRDAVKYVVQKIRKKNIDIIFIGHGSNRQEALWLKDELAGYSNTIGVCYANPVMGVHTGDNALLISFLEE